MNSTLARTIGLAGLAVLLNGTATQAQSYHGRKAWTLENDKIRLVITPGGGHIASAVLKSGRGANVNPLWLPPWPSTEPGGWKGKEAFYAGKPAAQLLCCILGHNLCLDFFGAPSAKEAAAGIPVHGEAPCVDWKLDRRTTSSITYSTTLPMAQMKVTRTVKLTPGGTGAWITETVENLRASDRPFGWQQHVTLGSPFLAAGQSFFDMNGGFTKVAPFNFSDKQRLKAGVETDWPMGGGKDGEEIDLRAYPTTSPNSDFTATLIKQGESWGWFTATNPKKGVLIGYAWPAKTWPWVGNWEEHHARTGSPWKGRATARGFEFGTTPFPFSLKEAVDMGKLHYNPTYAWIDAKGKKTVSYALFLAPAPATTTAVNNVTVNAAGIRVELEGAPRPVNIGARR